MTSRVAVRDANPVKVCHVHNTAAVTSYRTPSCDVIVTVARMTVRTRPTPTMYPEEKDVITSKFYKRNIQACSRSHLCCIKAVSECVSAALAIWHSMRTRHIILSSVACLAYTIFFHIMLQTAQLSGEKLLNMKCVF